MSYSYHPMIDIGELVGKTLVKCEEGTFGGEEALLFETDEATEYAMYHSQDCCESVTIEDIAGDLSDLIGSPILFAREDSNFNEVAYGDEQWTFYNIGTNKGAVTIRWFGSSNGYYSTGVDFRKTSK